MTVEQLPGRLGRVLRRARRDANLPLRVVAARAAMSLSFLSQVERGRALPSLELLLRIVGALGTGLPAVFALAEAEKDDQ